MTRLFHAAAGAIILAAVWLTVNRPPARANTYDPQAHLIELMQRAGLVYAGRRDIAQGEALLAFSQFGCPAQTAVLYLPWLSRMSPPTRALIARAATPPIYVNDGEVVDGLGMMQLMPRWAWRRLLVLLRLKHDEPWTSISLAVLPAPDCLLPPIDWARLPRG
jgi:hypothetical protein